MIGVIGSGSWATAIIKILQENPERNVGWWVRRAEVRDALIKTHKNPEHLTDTELDISRLEITGDLADIVQKCSHLILVIPSAHIASVLDSLPPEAYKDRKFVSAIKGAVPETLTSVSMYLETKLCVPQENICVISGPTHAEEVCRKMPTFLAVASTCEQLANEVEKLMACSYLHTISTKDIIGVEVAGLMKNVYAIGAGICQGVGYGDNLTAVYVTTAFREMQAVALNQNAGVAHDMAMNCYLGDLMVTCWSEHSRNRRMGYLLGKGVAKEDIFKEIGTVPEGYYSANIVHEYLTDMKDLLPLAEAVYRVLYEGSTVQNEMDRLINMFL